MGILEEYAKQNHGSMAAYERARRVLPSGCTRTVLHWPPFPLCLRTGRGTRLWDVDGSERIDYNFNNTTLILGHNHPKVMEAAEEQLAKGTVLGAPTEAEPALAEARASAYVPWVPPSLPSSLRMECCPWSARTMTP